MSYQSQDLLFYDPAFQGRSRSCATQQAGTFQNDQRPNYVATAKAVLRGEDEILTAFIRLNAAGPGIADKVEQPNGSIDQSLVTDADLLSLTQAGWPVVAGLYFSEDGTPIGG
jgi:hypothetical protein